MRVTIKERGQITIPARVRKDLMLSPGDLLEVEVRGGSLVLTPLEVGVRQVDRESTAAEGATS